MHVRAVGCGWGVWPHVCRVQDLISKLLVIDPSKRLTAQEALQVSRACTVIVSYCMGLVDRMSVCVMIAAPVVRRE